MATSTGKGRCIICQKDKSAVRCEGCLQIFCRIHLNDHCQELSKELDDIELSRDLFRQTLDEQINNPQKHVLIKQIEEWEINSIEIIRKTAKECKEILLQHTNEHFNQIEISLTKLTNQLRDTRRENDFNEMDLNQLKEKLRKLENELDQIRNISVQQHSTSFINKISVAVVGSSVPIITSSNININTKWKPNGLTIAGGNGRGDKVHQLSWPRSIYVNDDIQCIYIVDTENHRIVEWKYNAKVSRVVAGGNGQGDLTDQLNGPRDVIVDKKTDFLIICDRDNRRVVRWSLRNSTNGQTIISGIDCYSIRMDNNGDLYVCNSEKNEVRRWKIGETNGIVVAGGNGKGNNLNQLNYPTYLFVDKDYSVYVSDWDNHRVMKWMRGAKEGIVVAGGQGKGKNLTQLINPQGVIVDHLGNVYVADSGNHRIMCWSKGSKEGRIIVGGNGQGEQANQFSGPIGLSFDREDNLCVVDHWNNRIQKFEINLN